MSDTSCSPITLRAAPLRAATLRAATLRATTLGAALLLLASVTATAHAQTVDVSFPFELERWYRIEHTSGAITVHRVRLTHTAGGLASRIKRDDRYQQQVTLELEFSNEGDADWKCQTEVEWTDQDGLAIEGVIHRFVLDDHKSHDVRRESKAVLRYGLQRARTIHVKLRLDPD
jgi:hypothetical protein